MINYTEFLAATIKIDPKDFTQQRKDAIFKIFDVNNKNVIEKAHI